MTDKIASSYCTAWDAYNTPRLWAMVEDADDPVARDQVAAWSRLATSISNQRTALMSAREDLVEAWPEENVSATAFLMELDVLIKRLDTAAIDAFSTSYGLDDILNALQSAKQQIEPLYRRYQEIHDDWIPNWFNDVDDELDEPARQIMIATEQRVQESATQLKVPEPYVLHIQNFDEEEVETPGSGNGSGTSTRGGGIDVPVPRDPVPPLPGRDPIVRDAPAVGGVMGGGVVSGVVGGGIDLAGVINPLPPPPLPNTLPVVTPPAVTAGSPPIMPGLPALGLGSGPQPTGPTNARSMSRPLGGGIGDRGGFGRPQTGVPGLLGGPAPTGGGRGPAGGRGIGPGGMIGASGIPGAPLNSSGRGGMPVGQIGAAGSQGRGRPGSGPAPRPAWLPADPPGQNRQAMTPGMAGGRPGRNASERDQVGFDPDNPWQVAEGVRPVITPKVGADRHDPGPNVIGWHG